MLISDLIVLKALGVCHTNGISKESLVVETYIYTLLLTRITQWNFMEHLD
jgi:hypothetical protein